MAKPEYIKRNIQRMLKKAGLYRPELSYQIEMLANNICVYRKLCEKAIVVENPVIEEKTRDGTRKKPDPIFAMVQAQANQLRQDLKSLLMNYDKTDNKGMVAKDDKDPLAEFMAAVQSED